jgi:hypothetical protein
MSARFAANAWIAASTSSAVSVVRPGSTVSMRQSSLRSNFQDSMACPPVVMVLSHAHRTAGGCAA